jgi:uncharacterized membrane protein YidH (DUF202 family)
MLDPGQVRGFGAGPAPRTRKAKEVNPFLKFLGLAPSTAMRLSTPMKIEPKTFFANERTFLAWLHMAVTLGSISAALLGFSSDPTSGGEDLAKNMVSLISLILLPVAIFMVGYALYVFTWRADNIAKKKAVNVDDRNGPLLLCGMVVLALSAIFLLSCADFYELLSSMDDDSTSPPSPPALTSIISKSIEMAVGTSQ